MEFTLSFVPSQFTVGIYEIIIIQDPYGNLLTLKIEEYAE
tara:strand:- start:762 stop:881 length:120 start_codon:yes stop_codon:yes gene_type:complete